MFALRNPVVKSTVSRFFSTEAAPKVIELPYKITRTSSGKLPVYTEIINGNQTVTLVRRIEGNENALANELRRYFGDKIQINTRASKKVIVAGNQRLRVEAFLKQLGF